jgi:hypothetical protein
MKYVLLFFSVLSIAILPISVAHGQSLKGLDDNNGFKKYKLGAKFVIGQGVKTKDPEGSDKVNVGYVNETIGDIPVKAIELYYARDSLGKIIVRISPEYYEKLLVALKGAFGQPTQNFTSNEKVNPDSSASVNFYKDDFQWKTNRLRLNYVYAYPKTAGAYGIKELYLVYALNDFGQRLNRAKVGTNSAKNF